MRRFAFLALIVSGILSLGPVSANAQQPATGRVLLVQSALRACGADIYRFCNNVPGGGGRIAQCLMEHLEQLSPACRERVAGARAARGAYFACAADAQRLCPNVPPGGGRLVACLSQKRDQISRDCARALDEASDLLTPRR